MCQKNSVWFLCALFFMLSNVNIATSSKQALFNWKRKHEHTHTLTHSHFVKVNVYQEPNKNVIELEREWWKTKRGQCKHQPLSEWMNERRRAAFGVFPLVGLFYIIAKTLCTFTTFHSCVCNLLGFFFVRFNFLCFSHEIRLMRKIECVFFSLLSYIHCKYIFVLCCVRLQMSHHHRTI